jgi:O-acetyl-ADP-ribose deacetylase (regulator of RNase III)
MITVRGNVLDAFEKDGPVVILQQVNCQGVMGSGVAKAIRDKYPQVYTQYSWMVENSDPRQPSSQLLGNRQMIEVEKNKFVVNLFAQDFFGRDGRQYTNYEALRQSLMNLKYGLDARCLTDENVHHPMIGAGLGGGDWEVIQPIIENIIGFRTTLWVL